MSTIPDLIAAHREAFAAIDATCDPLDLAEESGDAAAIAAAEAVQQKACDDCADAMAEILTHPYTSLDDLREGIRYIVQHYHQTGDGDPQAWFVTLACSLAGIPEDGL